MRASGEVPEMLAAVIASAPQQIESVSPIVNDVPCPLPGIAAQIHHTEGTGTAGKTVNGGQPLRAVVDQTAAIGIAPGLLAAGASLCRVLPLGFGGQFPADIGRVGRRIRWRYIGDRQILQFRGQSAGELGQKVGSVPGYIARIPDKFQILTVGDRVALDVKGRQVNRRRSVLHLTVSLHDPVPDLVQYGLLRKENPFIG